MYAAFRRQEKPYNRPDGRWKCTPSAACGGVSPEGGDFGEALINSQNRISYVFLSNASSWDSLNSSLFASSHSLYCIKIQE